jgi:GAF domain-containing protein
MVDHDLGDRFAAVAREFGEQVTEIATLDHAVVVAREIIVGCDHAGVTLVHARRPVETAAATGEIAIRADQLQYELAEGPCLDSVRNHEVTLSPDLLSESRWPRWAPAASAALGIRSILCFQLFTTQSSYGALNLYSERSDAFDGDDQAVGMALAAHVAVALAATRAIESRDLAIARRTTIGQAEGILMERFSLDADQAFSVLRRVSQDTQRKLYEVAADLVRTGELPAESTSTARKKRRRQVD